mgnify:CR=1 FL=1
MSVQTLYTAATGMEALETKLDVIANNMANINTTGFKKSTALFQDILGQTLAAYGYEAAGYSFQKIVAGRKLWNFDQREWKIWQEAL